jgi:tRNA1(Val) A37 N6-methylase TrmN6
VVDSLIILDNKKQMIKNDIYTYDYFQPEEYKFSLDSVFLAQKVSVLIKERADLAELRILDLCAGCGIIGLELSLHRPELSSIDFLEIQESYLPYFEKNLDMIYPAPRKKELSFLNMNYKELLKADYQNHYDIILSNPPYFFKGEGLLSPSEFKNRCRFFLDSDFKTLIEAVYISLKPGGRAYLLVRKGTHHGRTPIKEMQNILGLRARAQVIDDVRGTDIIEIEKAL